MKKYNKPIIDICLLNTEDIISVSSTAQLIDGGANGKPASESYNALFTDK